MEDFNFYKEIWYVTEFCSLATAVWMTKKKQTNKSQKLSVAKEGNINKSCWNLETVPVFLLIKWQPWDVQQEVQLFLVLQKIFTGFPSWASRCVNARGALTKQCRFYCCALAAKVAGVQAEFKEVWRRCKSSWRKEGRRRPSELENERVGAKFPKAN